MQSRNAAFTLLRRLALYKFTKRPQTATRWIRPVIQQPFHSIVPRPFHHCARQFNNKHQPQESLRSLNQGPAQELPQEGLQSTQSASPASAPGQSRISREPQPSYEMTFTCKPCNTRSTHLVSKQGYHFGSVLITCPECKNRHIISDHLGIFLDKAGTIEDFMRDKGQLIKKGTLSDDGNLEFWEDDSITHRRGKDNDNND